ncbi:MAG: tetratricopeptide repeat-containing sensor histidine kinase [Cyclobacteriaceae bacterium]
MKGLAITFVFVLYLLQMPPSMAQYSQKDTVLVQQLLDQGYAYEIGQPDSALTIYQKAFEISNEIGYHLGAARALNYRGIVFSDQGTYGQAMDHYERAIDYYRKVPYPVGEASCLTNEGNIYQYFSDYANAIKYYLESIKILETEGDTSRLIMAYENLGGIYSQSNNWNKTREYYDKALHYAMMTKDTLNIGFINSDLSLVYLENKEYGKALQALKIGLEVGQQVQDDRLIYYTYLNFYNYYQKQDQLSQAIKFANKSLDQAKKLNNPFMESKSLSQLGYLFLTNGQETKALETLGLAIELEKRQGYKKHLVESYNHLFKLYQAQGRSTEALEAFRLSTAYNDSILNEEKAKYILLLEQQYQSEKKEKEIVLLAKEKEVQQAETKRQATLKKASMGGLAFVILLAALVVYTFWQRLKNQKLLATKDAELSKENFQKQVAQLEMKALRSQMNPHFIFNSMNSINSMILVDDTENASRYLTKFSKLVRLILENSENSTVRLKDELDMLETYIQLEAKRFNGKIDYQFTIDPGIDQETTKVPSMVLQPFIENAIWHGLMHKQEPGLIKIMLEEHGDQLQCIIEDNGVGREKALQLKEKKLHRQRSMGLKLTEERLKLLNKSELKKLINFTDLKDKMDRALGTRVKVIIPVS